jgi:hypothetical protein
MCCKRGVEVAPLKTMPCSAMSSHRVRGRLGGGHEASGGSPSPSTRRQLPSSRFALPRARRQSSYPRASMPRVHRPIPEPARCSNSARMGWGWSRHHYWPASCGCGRHQVALVFNLWPSTRHLLSVLVRARTTRLYPASV